MLKPLLLLAGALVLQTPAAQQTGSIQFVGEPDKTLEIVLGINAGTLAGRVEDERKQPAAGVFVTLVPVTDSFADGFRPFVVSAD